jgi:uncharacterized protein (TIGR03083 family)
MTLSTFDCIAAITRHSAGFAEATRDHLDARVEHCPDWSVADLVRHLTEVHWFWATIAEERPASPPDESRRPAPADDARLVDAFIAGAARLVEVLRNADQAAPCWTWAPAQQDVAFITRHQVQEAAVHHWDAVNAAGGRLELDPALAADSVDEFLTFSVPTDAADHDTPEQSLAGSFVLRASDTGDAWTLRDGDRPGTVRAGAGATEAPTLEAPASDLLLWLYGRRDLDTTAVPADLMARFRRLCFTD